MAIVDLIMPKMGESIMEATILNWLKNVNDTVVIDDPILEIATDKVDSEIPSPVSGKIIEILYQVDDVVEIGKVIARIATEGEDVNIKASPAINESSLKKEVSSIKEEKTKPIIKQAAPVTNKPSSTVSSSNSARFYSPLVRNIAKKEGISIEELGRITGTGTNGRVSKKDINAYVSAANTSTSSNRVIHTPIASVNTPKAVYTENNVGDNVEIIEMDRMRKLISDHMVMSKQTSPHVSSFVEADVTNIVNWRNKVKEEFIEKHGQKITFTPIFIQAVAKALTDFPMVNVSVDGTRIIRKKDINIGMAAALPSGNLIVPVIKNADNYSLSGLAKTINDFASRARQNKLKPDEIQGGTFTITNVGTFGNIMGTPIINQPQVAILATGVIQKKPAVLETEFGDVIAIRYMMYLSLSYDHRVVDGFLGGSFLRKIADYLEGFDYEQSI